jgi:hypothetical protein
MNLNSPPTLIEKINFRVFIFLLFLFQVIFIFQGIDLSDEGFYATFYQQIYDHPESAQYNFMFWFSGIVGGAVTKIFPGLGLWGIRFAGVLVTTGTIIITYNLLKKYLNAGYLKLGLLMVVLFINNNLKMVHYNDLSALLNMATIYFLFRALKENKSGKLFAAGLLVSLSTFTRLPNILCLGLGLAIFLDGYFQKTSFKKQFIQLIVFGCGFVFMTAVLLGLMKLLGHLGIFLNSIKLLSKMGSGGEESFYGPVVLIKTFIVTHAASLKYALVILVGMIAGTATVNYIKKYPFYKKWIIDAGRYAIALLLCALLFRGTINKEILLYFYIGLTLIITALIVITRTDNDIKLLSLMGLYILLTYPFSSSAGIFTVGIYSLWLSFPVAINYLFSATSLTGQITLFRSNTLDNGGFVITEPQLKQIRNLVVFVCMVGSLVHTYRYPFFDKHDRLKMASSIDSKYLKGIFTTKERATALNELLQESSKYVKENDYMLAYQCTPMLNYITHTTPYMRNSYPWLYDAETFKTELYKGLDETKTLPVVVMQKIKTIGASSNWPDPATEDVSVYEKKNEKRNSYMNEFLQNNNYKEVWSNNVFRIFVPKP